MKLRSSRCPSVVAGKKPSLVTFTVVPAKAGIQ